MTNEDKGWASICYRLIVDVVIEIATGQIEAGNQRVSPALPLFCLLAIRKYSNDLGLIFYTVKCV